MKTLSKIAAIFVGVLCLNWSGLHAEDYQGAEAVLKQVDAAAQNKDAGPKARPAAQLREDIKAYQLHAEALPPEQMAREWLALFDRACQISSREYVVDNEPAQFRGVFQALPPPAAWDTLAAQIAARPLPAKGTADFSTPALRVVAAMLQGKPEAVRQGSEAIRQQTENLDTPQGLSHSLLAKLQEAVLDLTDDKAAKVRNFERTLDLIEGKDRQPGDEDARSLRMNSVNVPDLVALVGPAKAEALLRRAFALPLTAGMEFRGEKTQALARRVALEMGDALKFAPWNLVDTLDAVPLYRLLAKRFPETESENESEHRTAEIYSLLGLIVQGDYPAATALALKQSKQLTPGEEVSSDIPENIFVELATKGHAKEVSAFFTQLLTAHPEIPYWDAYSTAAVLADDTETMLALAKTASERTDLKPRQREALRETYGKALLAADHVAEALPILREQQKAEASHPAEDATAGRFRMQTQTETATRLAQLGQLLGDEALRNEQLDLIARALQGGTEDQPGRESLRSEAIDLFLDAKRGPELERILAVQLEQATRQANRGRGIPGTVSMPGFLNGLAQPPLCALVDLYARAGRHEDVVRLLDHATGWGVEDVAALLNRGYGTDWHFGNQVARALQKTGHTEAALALVNADLALRPGLDADYALLLELLPPEQAELRLKALFEGDQFEERPLIWRAVLQLGQGKLDEAEKSARQAISIDPSDGDEGRGDRLRAYAVLADVLERKGDTEKAGQMRQAVKAIRLSEDADQFHVAGLLTRAVGMYEKALGYFSDAYCIQSRLAIQLTNLGKFDEAMTHYERAYELMPESFGRMESHCFGCEKAFAGERAQATAEKVFQRLAAKEPQNPRVHYLMGYLREEEDRDAEAAKEFAEAVRLDPDYINAWKHLASNTEDAATRDRATLNLLRLDPQRKHDAGDLTKVADLRALWQAVAAAAKFAQPAPKAIYPLAASKAQLENERQGQPVAAATDETMEEFYPNFQRYNRNGEPQKPGQVILGNDVVSAAIMFLHKNGPGGIDDVMGGL